MWALDLALPNGTWIEKAPMPYNRSNFGTAVFGTKLYTAGGYGNYGISESAGFPFGRNVKGTDGWGAGAGGAECVQANVDVYDGVANKWSSLSPMTVARGGLSLGIVLTPDPVVYAVGGFHCTNGAFPSCIRPSVGTGASVGEEEGGGKRHVPRCSFYMSLSC